MHVLRSFESFEDEVIAIWEDFERGVVVDWPDRYTAAAVEGVRLVAREHAAAAEAVRQRKADRDRREWETKFGKGAG